MNEVLYFMGSDGKYWKFSVNNQDYWQQTGSVDEGNLPSGAVVVDTMPGGLATQEGNSYDDYSEIAQQELSGSQGGGDTSDDDAMFAGYEDVNNDGAVNVLDIQLTNQTIGQRMASGEGYGAGTFDPRELQGMTEQQAAEKIAEIKFGWESGTSLLDAPFNTAGTTWTQIKEQLKSFLPKYQGVPEEERGFAKEAYQRDIYGVSKEAGKVSAQMGRAYGGMGTSMRGAVGGMKDVSQQFKQAGQMYGESIYGLEKGAETQYEREFETFLEGFRKGGRVPNKKSFLEILTALPEAGGS